MQKILYILVLAMTFGGCMRLPEEDFVVSGNLYFDCAKKPLKNVLLEVKRTGGGLGGQKTEQLATARTAEDGSFRIDYRTHQGDKLVLAIAANDASQMYSSMSLKSIETGKDNTMLKFYTQADTDIKIRLNCGRVYTNQDTLYIEQPFVNNNTIVNKIIAPQHGMILDFKKGDPTFGAIPVGYGIGRADYKKASSGVNGQTPYNVLWITYPSCDKSPMEIVLNLP
jgi:hypothetical protein